MENFIDDDLSDESDNQSMDETEPDNDESNNLLKAKKRILITIKNWYCVLIIHYQAFISVSMFSQHKSRHRISKLFY